MRDGDICASFPPGEAKGAAAPVRQTTFYLPLYIPVLYHTRRIAVKESADSPEFLYFLLNLSEKALQTAQNML